MLRQAILIVLAIHICFALPAFGQEGESAEIFSPSTARVLHDMGCELNAAAEPNSSENRAALVFFNAAMQLDRRADYILPDVIKVASSLEEPDYSNRIYSYLLSYVDEECDLEVAREGLAYVMDKLNAREQRQALLRDMTSRLGERNSLFSSELYTRRGLLAAETADYQTATSMFVQAFQADPSNRLAFAKLSEVAAEPLPPAAYTRHYRLLIRDNPFDLDSCLQFAASLESVMLYGQAAGAYKYCSDLFGYMHPDSVLPAAIYLPRALSCYNSGDQLQTCLEMTAELREKGVFDVILQAIAARAAAELGHQGRADELLDAVDQRAQRMLAESEAVSAEAAQRFAWFYCFAAADAEKALLWANKSFAAAPDSETAMALLAYSLVMNEQYRYAAPLADQLGRQNQIAAIAKALVELNRGNAADAREVLKEAVFMDPGSLEARRARGLLRENDSEYIPDVESAAVLENLRNDFGESLVPKFSPPGEIVSLKLAADAPTGLSYGSRVEGKLMITNQGSEAFAISANGLFKGHIRIDAEVSGDLSNNFPALVTKVVHPSSPVEPGRTAYIPLRLIVGPLKDMLKASPQADLEIKFTAYLDPVTDETGRVRNAIAELEPAELVLQRNAVKVTRKYLQSRLDYLSGGNQNQKIKTINLFAGFLLEQETIAESAEAPYSFTYEEPVLLKSALLRGLNDENWVVRLRSITAIKDLPLDYELVNAVAKNLYAEGWPVRMVALFVLAKTQGRDFAKVVNSVGDADDSEFVRGMAVAFSAELKKPLEPAGPPQPTGRAPAAEPPEETPLGID